MKRSLLTVATLLVAVGAHADVARPFAAPTTVNTVAPPGVGSLGTVTLALALVLAAIFAAAWLLRRVRGFGRASGTALDVIAELPVGQKERAVLIRVGTTQILIGVAPGRVSTLHVLSEPVQGLTPGTQPGFAGEREPGADGGARRAAAEQRPTFRSLLMKSLGKP